MTRTVCTIDKKIVDEYLSYICESRGTNKSENRKIKKNIWNVDEVDSKWDSDVEVRNSIAGQIPGFRIIDYMGLGKHGIVMNVNTKKRQSVKRVEDIEHAAGRRIGDIAIYWHHVMYLLFSFIFTFIEVK